jgi:hypothetical protein
VFLSVSATIVALGVAFNTGTWPSVAESLGRRVSWFGVACAATCAFSAGMCLSRALFSRPSRLLGFSLAAATAYMLAVLSSYEHGREPWPLVSKLLWVSIPLTLAFWARSAFAVTGQLRRTRVVVSPFWGRVAATSRNLSHRRLNILSVRIPHAELVGIWLPCIAFSIANLVPGFVYQEQYATRKAWEGWSYEPRWPYFLLCLWGFIVLGIAALVVEAAWRTRATGAFAGATVRARGARVATKWAVVAASLLFLSAWTNWWPEPVLDIPVAALFGFFALRSVDADSYSSATHAFSSIRRRWVWGSGWVALSVVLAAMFGKGPFMTGFIASMLAFCYPMLPAALRAVDGLPRTSAEGPGRPSRLTVAAAEEFAARLAGRAEVGSIPSTGSIVAAHEMIESLTIEDFRLLIGGLPTRTGRQPATGRDPRDRAQLRGFIAELPLLDAYDEYDARLDRFVKLFYETIRSDPAVAPKLRRRRDKLNPSNQWITRAYCLDRITLATDEEEEREELRMGLMYRLWLRRWYEGAKSDGRPVYEWSGGPNEEARIVNMGTEELNEALEAIKGRRVYDASKKKRNRALTSALERTKARWLEILSQLEREAARQRLNPEG